MSERFWRVSVIKDDGNAILTTPDGLQGEWAVGPRPLHEGEVWVANSISISRVMTKSGIAYRHQLQLVRLVDEVPDMREYAREELQFIMASTSSILGKSKATNVHPDKPMCENAFAQVEYENRVYDVVYFLRLGSVLFDYDRIVITADIRITLRHGIRAGSDFVNVSKVYENVKIVFKHDEIIGIENLSVVVADDALLLRVPVSRDALTNVRTVVSVDKTESGRQVIARRVGDLIVNGSRTTAHTMTLSTPINVVIDDNGIVVSGSIFDIPRDAFDVRGEYEGDASNGTGYLSMRMISNHDVVIRVPVVDVIDGYALVLEPDAIDLVQIPKGVVCVER